MQVRACNVDSATDDDGIRVGILSTHNYGRSTLAPISSVLILGAIALHAIYHHTDRLFARSSSAVLACICTSASIPSELKTF